MQKLKIYCLAASFVVFMLFPKMGFAQYTFGEDTLDQKKVRKNEVGINVLPVLLAFHGINNFSPNFIFSYKRLHGKNAFRSNLNLNWYRTPLAEGNRTFGS